MPTRPQRSRSLWPIVIASYFAVVIVGIAIFITWAVRQNMDLVRNDYYAEEMRFQQHLDQKNRAEQLKWKPQVDYDHLEDAVVVTLPNQPSAVTGQVHLYRPSSAALDQTTKLSLNTDGMQRIDARTLQNGLWKVRITWMVGAAEFFSEETIVITRS